MRLEILEAAHATDLLAHIGMVQTPMDLPAADDWSGVVAANGTANVANHQGHSSARLVKGTRLTVI